MRTQPFVLLVDDEEIFLEIASVKLHANGFMTAIANDVRDALEKAESLQPDLVLSDIYMPPGPSGWELALKLRHNPKTCAIKLAFFTSLSDPWLEMPKEERQKITSELGNVVFLSKTDDVDTLATGVSRLIGVREN